MTYPYQAIIEGTPRKIIDVDAEGKYMLDGGERLELHSPKALPIRSRPLKRVAKLRFDGKDWFLDGEDIKIRCIDAQTGRRAGREGRTEEQTILELMRILKAVPAADGHEITGAAWFDERAGRVEGETVKDCEQRKEFLANHGGCETIEPLPPADRFMPVLLTDFGRIKRRRAGNGPHVKFPPSGVTHKAKAAKSVARFENDFSVAIIPQSNGKEKSVTVEPELQDLIKRVINAGGHLPRTKLRKDKSDTYQPEKFLSSEVAKTLIKAKLLGKNKSGRTTVFWAKLSAG